VSPPGAGQPKTTQCLPSSARMSPAKRERRDRGSTSPVRKPIHDGDGFGLDVQLHVDAVNSLNQGTPYKQRLVRRRALGSGDLQDQAAERVASCIRASAGIPRLELLAALRIELVLLSGVRQVPTP
jgi:hypothetical protein